MFALPAPLPAQSAEEQAFRAALRASDPKQRIAALEAFLTASPAGSDTAAARDALLDTYLQHDPANSAALHRLGSQQWADAPAGPERWLLQCQLASTFAAVEPAGADLDDAQAWAEAAHRSMTQEAYRRGAEAERLRFHLPRTPAAQLQRQFRSDRATCLAALAAVELRRGAPAQAGEHIRQALVDAPLSAHANLLRAELIWSTGPPPAALEALLRASALAPLPPVWQQRERTLFHALTGGDEHALQQRIDALYTEIYPKIFRLPPRAPLPQGHAVLLELFTGSDCYPCTAADLAVDSLLGSYSRDELVALEWDVSIPRPDPLATAASEARADLYGVRSTPTAFLDGVPAELLGSARADTENVVIGLADTLESIAPRESPITVALDLAPVSPGVVQPTLHVERSRRSLPADATTGALSLRVVSRATVFIALVQDDLRYPGANGVRLHRMVVRSLQQQPLANVLDRPAVALAPIALAAVQQANTAWLQHYAEQNDQFGTIQFQQTDFPLNEGRLGFVTWVQDPETHTVFAAHYAPLP